ncbi:aminotransferase class III-fold pyridoxal phosphate-dependent enzyme [Streptomyces lydicus]
MTTTHPAASAAAAAAGGPAAGAAVKAADRAHVFHSWSAQGLIDPLPIAGAEGSYFWDYDGNRYLDFSSQLVNTNIGHQHPKVVAAIQEQAAKLCTLAPGFAVDVRSEAARLIAERTPGDLDKIFFTNGGAEAVENAVRMARLHTGRAKVLSAYRSYHGATAAAINLTGDPRRWPSDTASAVATLEAMAEERIVENAAEIGEKVIGPGLREIAERHPSVGEVRGLGVFWALDLVRNKETREPLVPYNASGAANAPMAEFAAACKRGGLWPFVNMNRTHVVPACTVTEAEAKEGLTALDEALTAADAHTV